MFAYAPNPTGWVDPLGLQVEVYVWEQAGSFGDSNFQWGHASMKIKNNSNVPDTYISLWPNQEARIISQNKLIANIYTAPAFQNRTFQQDRNAEGRAPDHIITINGLNEKDIYDWWKNNKSTWSSLSNNCSTAVANALKAGGADVRFYNEWSAHNNIWTPTDVAEYAKDIKKHQDQNAKMKRVWDKYISP